LRLGRWVERTYVLAEVELGITVLSDQELIELDRITTLENPDYVNRHKLSLFNWHDRQLAKIEPDDHQLANRPTELDRHDRNFHQQSIDYIQNLIKAAIAYFFNQKARQIDRSAPDTQASGRSTLSNANPNNSSNGQPWLTMAELFGDDNSHWPPLQHQQASATNATNLNTTAQSSTNGSNANQPKSRVGSNQTHSPTHITSSASAALADPWSYADVKKAAQPKETSNHDQAKDGAIVAANHATTHHPTDATEIESIHKHLNNSTQVTATDRQHSEQELDEFSRPMQAWIEAKATFMGYVYSPAMQVIHWLDRLVAKIEQWLGKVFGRGWQWLKSLFGKS
jgi:hypothetical protein